MIIINQSFLQLLTLFLLTLKKRNNNFYIVYTEKPKAFIKILIYVLNHLSKNKYFLKNIYFFRNQYEKLSNQVILNNIDKNHSILFSGNKRLGGQIYLENVLRKYIWQNCSFDVLIQHFFYQNIKKKDGNNNEEIFKILNYIRGIERKILNRIIAIKCSIGFIFFIVKNFFKLKIYKNFREKIHNQFSKNSSFVIHDYNINK